MNKSLYQHMDRIVGKVFFHGEFKHLNKDVVPLFESYYEYLSSKYEECKANEIYHSLCLNSVEIFTNVDFPCDKCKEAFSTYLSFFAELIRRKTMCVGLYYDSMCFEKKFKPLEVKKLWQYFSEIGANEGLLIESHDDKKIKYKLFVEKVNFVDERVIKKTVTEQNILEIRSFIEEHKYTQLTRDKFLTDIILKLFPNMFKGMSREEIFRTQKFLTYWTVFKDEECE